MVQHIESKAPDSSPDLSPSKPLPAKRGRIKIHDIFFERHSPVYRERAIWVAVITQAMLDALSKSKSAESLYYKKEALDWLTGNSTNFAMVCQYAGFDPSYIRRMAKKALVCPKALRAAAGHGSRYHERKVSRTSGSTSDASSQPQSPAAGDDKL